MTAISSKLPLINMTKFAEGGEATPYLYYNIQFNYKHFEGGSLSMDWMPEYAADFVCADNDRTMKRRLNGYRFTMQATVTDMFLKAGVANGYEQELFETYMNSLSIWDKEPLQNIYVYPFYETALLTLYYACRLDGFVKRNYQFSGDGSFKTKGHIYDISLTALKLTQTKPTPSY